jgi:L-amino acid N-acyltransferase YncA
LPCQPAPFISKYYGESSTYIKPGFHNRGIARDLLLHATTYAREKSELMYIVAYIGEKNRGVQKLATEFGFRRIGKIPRSAKDQALPDFEFWVLPL